MRGIKDAHTDTRTSHSLRSVATWTGAVVAASGVLTDLIVSALMSSISALIDVYSRPQKDSSSDRNIANFVFLQFFPIV